MNVLMNFSIRRVESKFNIFVSDGHQLVWRRVGITLEGYNTESTFKHGSGVSWYPKGQDCYMYLEMLRQHIPASVAILGLPSDVTLVHGKCSKDTVILVKEGILCNIKKTLPYPPQSLKSNPIEHLQKRGKNQKGLEESHRKDIWKYISAEVL